MPDSAPSAGPSRGWISEPSHRASSGEPQARRCERLPHDFDDRSFYEQLEDAAEREPDRVVVDDGSVQLTYGAMRSAVRRLAFEIDRLTPPGRPVIAYMRNDARFPIIALACRASGRPVVAIETSTPAERTAALIRETDASAVIVPEAAGLDLSAFPEDMVRIAVPISGADVGRFEGPRDLDAPASITFTSGSTGRPKGVVYSERQSLYTVKMDVLVNGIGRDDVILQMASVSALGLRNVLTAVVTGARVRLLDLKACGLSEALRIMRDEGVTQFSFVISSLRALIGAPGIAEAFSNLRVLSLIGEAITAVDVARLRAVLPVSCRIGLSFGSTEVGAVFHWFAEGPRSEELRLPVGRLQAERCIRLVDSDGHPVAPGEEGELVVSDAKVALGYWRDGRLDDARFRAGPDDPGVRAFRTGDVMKLGDDGMAEFRARRDRMVKVRGLQADLGDIEAVLKGAPLVKDAAVVALDRESGATMLVAFVTAASPKALDTRSLRTRVVVSTSEHMAPHRIHVRDELPRLANGKPDLVRLNALAAELEIDG